MPQPIKSSADLYALIDDGTEPPLPRGERLKIYHEIEAILKERATLDTDPLTLPDDFKRLCALTNKLSGPAFPSTNSCIPDAFDSLHNALTELRYPDEHGEKATAFGLGDLDYTPGIMLSMGGIKATIEGERQLGVMLVQGLGRALELEMGTSRRLRRAAGGF